MKREILPDRILAALDGGGNGIEALRDLADLRQRAALGGEPGGLDLDAGAQLHHVEHRAQRRQAIELDAQRRTGIFRHECPDALAGDDETIRTQRRDRLAHHGAAHAGRRDQLLLGGQARSRLDLAAGDIVGEPRDELAGQRARGRQRPARRKDHARPAHRP
jgi:hypothetical protein